jgi:TRAP-type C4-dicarboxylate transport system substrate-binding protein
MEKKIWRIWTVVSVCLAALIASGLGKPVLAQKEKTIEWTFGFKPTRNDKGHAHAYWFVDELEKRTNGRFKIKVVDSDTLGAPREQPFLCGKGAFEMVYSVQAYFPAQFPLGSTQMLPLLPPKEPNAAIRWLQYVNFHPLAQEEMRRVDLINIWSSLGTGYQLWANRKIEKREDFKGLTMRATAGYGKWAEGLGATPVDLTIFEVYEAFQRNMIQACSYNASTGELLKWYEVCKYFIIAPESWGTASVFYGANLNAWNRLPQDIKTIVAELQRELPDKYSGWAANIDDDSLGRFKDKYGITILHMSNDEWTKVKQAAKPAYDSWWEFCKKRGIEKQARQYWKDIIAKKEELTGQRWTLWFPPE